MLLEIKLSMIALDLFFQGHKTISWFTNIIAGG